MRKLFAVLLLAGCGGPAQLVRVEPSLTPDVREMPIVDERGVTAQFKPDPLALVDKTARVSLGKDTVQAQETGAAEKDARMVMAEAQADGLNEVSEGSCSGGVCKYRYSTDEEYLLYGCYRTELLVILAPGEKWNDDGRKVFAKGWKFSKTESGDGKGNIVDVLVLRQVSDTPGVQKAWFTTNVGPYLLRLEAADPGEERCMRGLTFLHPQRELARLMREASRRRDDADDDEESRPAASLLSAQYTIEVVEGNPAWVPTAVMAQMTGDHAQVVIQFPRDVAWTKKPVIMTDGGVTDCRWLPETHAYVCDNSFRTAIIKMGSSETGYEKVRIRKAKEAS